MVMWGVGECVHATVWVEVRGQLSSVGFLFPHAGAGDWAQVTRLSCECLYSLSHLIVLIFF